MEEQVLFEFGSKDAKRYDDKGPSFRYCRGIVDEEANVLIMLCGGEMGRIWQICLETRQWNFLVAHGNDDSIVQQGSELLGCPIDMCMDRKRVIHVLCSSSSLQSSIQCVDRTQRRTWTLCANLPDSTHMMYSYRDDCLYLSSWLGETKLFQYGLDGNFCREIRLYSSPSVPLRGDVISGLCEMPSGVLLVQHIGSQFAEVDMHAFDWDCPVVRPWMDETLYQSIFVACPEGSIWVNESRMHGAENMVRKFRERRILVGQKVCAFPIAMGSDGKLFLYKTNKDRSPHSITVLQTASLSCRQVVSTLARQLVNVAGTLLPDPLWMIVAGYAIWPFGFPS